MFTISKSLPPQSLSSICTKSSQGIKLFRRRLQRLSSPKNSIRRIHSIHPELLNKFYCQKIAKSVCHYYQTAKFKKELESYVKTQKYALMEYSLFKSKRPKSMPPLMETNQKEEKSKKKTIPEEVIDKKKIRLQQSQDSESAIEDENTPKENKALTIIEFVIQKKQKEFKQRQFKYKCPPQENTK